jgi:hypothetical protein
MYIVFFCFFARLYLRIFSTQAFSWNVLSLKWLFSFLKTLTLLFNKFVRSFFSLK